MRNDENSFTKRKRQKAKRDEAMHREQKTNRIMKRSERLLLLCDTEEEFWYWMRRQPKNENAHNKRTHQRKWKKQIQYFHCFKFGWSIGLLPQLFYFILLPFRFRIVRFFFVYYFFFSFVFSFIRCCFLIKSIAKSHLLRIDFAIICDSNRRLCESLASSSSSQSSLSFQSMEIC